VIYYREGYKYQLAKDFTIQTPITPSKSVKHQFFTLTPSGKLTVKSGYAWDGASGPTIDTKDSMSPSLVHDVFCQMMRSEMLSFNDWQDKVNEFFREHLKQCGMGSFRAWYWYQAVEFADCGRPDGKEDNPVLEAP
jgi:hypothetical protein